METTNQESLSILNRKQVRQASKSWEQAVILGQHPLALPVVVQGRHQAAGYTETDAGYGMAIRDILQEALDRLKPTVTESHNHQNQWGQR